MSRRALIVGGGGQIGRAVCETLLSENWSVVSIEKGAGPPRSPSSAEGPLRVILDRDDDPALKAQVSQGFDAVIDTVAFTAEHAGQWSRLQQHFGALVVISSGSVYADDRGRTLDEAAANGPPDYPVPIPESQNRTPPGDQTYSTRKRALEDRLMNEVRRPCSILRPFAIYGEASRSPREWWFLTRLLQGQTRIPLAYGGLSRFHTTASRNIAELCKVALAHGGSHVLNIADPECLTVFEIGRAIILAMGSSAELQVFDGPPKGLFGFTPWSVASPLVADLSAAAAIGYRPVTDFAASAPGLCRHLLAAAAQSDWTTAFPGLQPYPAAMFQKDPDTPPEGVEGRS